MVVVIDFAATTPSTLTPTYEQAFPPSASPQVSRKNSLVSANRCSPLQEEVHHQQRETVIRFQLENEIISAKAEPVNSEPSASVSEDVNKTDGSCGSGANQLGQLYFKVR